MMLEREVRHKSEDISDDVLSDVVKAIGRRVRVSHDYDVSYIAGYSTDGRVFIDRHLPRTFRSWTQTIRVAPLLLVALRQHGLVSRRARHASPLRTAKASVGATHASPCNHRRACRKRARHASP
jgi:hypothetical protein